MSEMLGNQYFLARNYSGAAKELEKALLKDPRNKYIRRKLIVCYTQIGHIQRAMDVFLSLIKEDVDFIINTDPVDDDCPCAELVYDAERFFPNNKQSVDYHLMMGMLWLYCDAKKSLFYFKKAQELDPENSRLKSVISILDSRIHVQKI